jgi:hypothetical protein
MLKWLKNKQSLLSESQQVTKRRLTRKERYVKKYLNNEKVYQLWLDLNEKRCMPELPVIQEEESVYYRKGSSIYQR